MTGKSQRVFFASLNQKWEFMVRQNLFYFSLHLLQFKISYRVIDDVSVWIKLIIDENGSCVCGASDKCVERKQFHPKLDFIFFSFSVFFSFLFFSLIFGVAPFTFTMQLTVNIQCSIVLAIDCFSFTHFVIVNICWILTLSLSTIIIS